MLLNDFSQLAALTNPYTLHGAVSWKSIAQAQHADPNASFSRMVVPAQVFDYDVRLLRALDTLQREGFIFVRDFDRKISGIITAADVVNKYDETATPFLLIGEVDQELRRLIQSTFDAETVREACAAAGQTFKSFAAMTMGNYQPEGVHQPTRPPAEGAQRCDALQPGSGEGGRRAQAPALPGPDPHLQQVTRDALGTGAQPTGAR